MRSFAISLLLSLLLFGCADAPPTSPPAVTPTEAATPTQTAPAATSTPPPTQPATCADLDATWGNWPVVIDVLTQLAARGETCGLESLDAKRYAAHFSYAVSLEEGGELETAIEQYQAALAIDGQRPEALKALIRLAALPNPTPAPCSPGELAPYQPADTEASFVGVDGGQLILDGEPFIVRGVNYYPRHAPWNRFLMEGDLGEIAAELDLIAGAELNTIRIFLWYDPLFTCEPETATPNPDTFAKLDALLAMAGERGLHVIVTLNDLPDLYFRPIYTDWARYDAQTAFIIDRYRDEPAILAWDLRNEGDLNYGVRWFEQQPFEQAQVLDWLAHVSEQVRALDDRHLLTAGWWGEAAETAGMVDVLSFHHWEGSARLAERIAELRSASPDKPILIEEVGYPSWGDQDEAGQAQALGEALAVAEENGAAGWLVWTAFDFTPPAGQPDSVEYHFGLWRGDLSPKPALDRLPLAGD